VLGQGKEEDAAQLLARARSESPAVKRVILDSLISKAGTLTLLLDAIDKQQLQVTDVDPTLVPRIVNVADPALKARAQKLFAPPPSADLQKTLAEYSAALQPDINAKAGRALFEKHCATCHKVGDVGVDVAPDISDSRTKTAAQILLDVLQPNRAVDGNYVAYVVTKTDGQVLNGVISAETSQAITLKQPGGMSVVVPRSEIDELQSTGKSLMPEGLERNIPPQEMAQIISYVKNWRYLDGRVPASRVK
jgi:putative heme-binding domain-containing protein